MKFVQLLASAAIISLPLYVVRCKSFSWCSSPVPFTLPELLILATFFVWFFWRILSVKKDKKPVQRLYKRLTGPLFWPLVLFTLSATLAIFVLTDLRSAAGIWKAYFIEPALFYIVILDLSLEKKSIFWIIIPLLFSGLWVSFLAIWQALSGTNDFASYAIAQGRVSSIYTTPNALGLYLGPLVMLALGFLLDLLKNKEIKSNRSKVFWYLIICILAFIVAIILSKSRGAGVGLISAFAAFILFAIYPRLSIFRKNLFRWGVILIVVAYFLVNILVFIKIDSFVAAYKPVSQDSIEARFCIWQATKNMIGDRPITGNGLAAYQKVYPSYATCYSEAHLFPHNILLNFWSEVGVLGLLAFLWICRDWIVILSKNLKNLTAVGLVAALVYLYMHGLVDVPYFKNDLAAEFWIFLSFVSFFGVGKFKNQDL